MNSMLKKTLCLILALCLMAGMSAAAFAEEQSVDDKMSILDDAALKAMVNDLLASYNIEGQRLDHISFAYTYLATGDTWYYNPDMWYYPGSIYKVPMMMVLAEREAKGELSRDSDLGGYTLGEAEELILVWSNNDYAHLVRKYLGGDANARKLYQAYSDLPETYYHSDFIDYCFFTVRYMDDVMQHLYNNRENFPNIIESLLVAMPNNFYHLKIDPSIQIAQKYGAFEQFNANTGIIYTENPFVLTIMSDCLSYDKAEHLMGDAAKLFMDYTLALDAQLAAYEQELAAAEAKAAEEARLKAEEEARIAREKAEAEAAAERERLAEEQRLKEEAEAAARREKIMKIAAVAGAAVAVIGAVAAVIVHSVRKKRRERELARRRELIRQRRYGLDEEESHASFRSSRGGRGSDSYRPRH